MESHRSRAVKVEAAMWSGLALLATVALATTISSSFPARSRALLGEGLVIVLSGALAVWALDRGNRRTPPGNGRRIAAGLRVLLLGPLLLFFLVAAAAGFAA